MKQKCKKCGVNAESEYCFRHKPKKAIPKYGKLTREIIIKNIHDILYMKEFFRLIWEEREHKSEISGEKLNSPPSSAYFHHILPKNNYFQAAFDPENIIILTIEEHDQVGIDMYRYEEINKRREQLKIKYNI